MRSTDRVAISGHLPEQWLDRLLSAHCRTRVDAPFAEAAEQILGVARQLCDDAAFGVRVPRSALPGEAGEAEPVVVRLAPSRASHPIETDPTKLFPELAYERVIPFLIEHGATLHAAADDPHRFVSGSPAALLLDRVAQILAWMVENQRAVEQSKRDLRDRVIQSEKLAELGQLAASIGHELGTPLTTIINYSEQLQRKLAAGGDPVDVRALALVHDAGKRIFRLARDLTVYSRPDHEEHAPVAIHDVIDRALEHCEHELDNPKLKIERRFGAVRPVRGVAWRLNQVFVNLFTNAAHAMREEGGLLCIVTTMADGSESEVVITVIDDGHGIDAEHRARIFEPFFTTKKDGSGTGLGLSIVHNIVRSHSGRISVYGNEPRGTVFQLELPAAPPGDGD